ncbi:hypothetical protein Bdiaspc4_43095 [Bradyrhizobium diazoefficiens]|nr:hypothetical protein Bdiaspc4_43095 [Bradyrhizobium diazoefficiens]
MRSIEPGISRFRVRLCEPPRNDGRHTTAIAWLCNNLAGNADFTLRKISLRRRAGPAAAAWSD